MFVSGDRNAGRLPSGATDGFDLCDRMVQSLRDLELSVGLEQVAETAGGIGYKAVVADRRKLDAKVEAALKGSKSPALFVDDAAALTAEKLAALLKSANVAYDDKTPGQVQLAEGPATWSSIVASTAARIRPRFSLNFAAPAPSR